eukprot:COSAG03_NODE_16418_length_402_cov_1.343234_1_plen_58_part_01
MRGGEEEPEGDKEPEGERGRGSWFWCFDDCIRTQSLAHDQAQVGAAVAAAVDDARAGA